MIEEVIDALKTILVANLSTTLDTIDAEHADSIKLEDIPTDRIFTYGEQMLPKVPAIVLLAQGSPPDEMISGTNYSPTDFTHTIFVICIVGDTHKENLNRKSFRYLDALWRIIKNNPNLGLATATEEVINTIITDHAHSNFYEKGSGNYRKDFYLKLNVKERIKR